MVRIAETVLLGPNSFHCCRRHAQPISEPGEVSYQTRRRHSGRRKGNFPNCDDNRDDCSKEGMGSWDDRDKSTEEGQHTCVTWSLQGKRYNSAPARRTTTQESHYSWGTGCKCKEPLMDNANIISLASEPKREGKLWWTYRASD